MRTLACLVLLCASCSFPSYTIHQEATCEEWVSANVDHLLGCGQPIDKVTVWRTEAETACKYRRSDFSVCVDAVVVADCNTDVTCDPGL